MQQITFLHLVYRVYQYNPTDNPTLASHYCALITGCKFWVCERNFLKVKDQGLSCSVTCFLCHFEQSGTNMRTVKIVGRNHIVSPLCLIKAVHNKRKRNQSRMCHGYKEHTTGFTRFTINNSYLGRLLR